MYDAHIICRFSDQDEVKIPIEHQKSRCLEVAQNLGCRSTTVKIIANDNLLSTMTWDGRADLQELERDVKAGSCQRLIIYSIDNLISNADVADKLSSILIKEKVKLYFAQVIDIEEALEPELRGKIRISPEVRVRKILIRGFPPEWCLSRRGVERQTATALAKWAKQEYPQSTCFVRVAGMVRYGTVDWFYPDIDVLVVTGDEVISHEVKLLEGKKTGLPLTIDGKTMQVVEELRTVRLIDKAIYDGLGKALFNCLKSDRSYLVVPAPAVRNELSAIVNQLPIGLMVFDESGNFFFLKKCPAQTRILGKLRDDILKLAQEGNKGRWAHCFLHDGLIFSSKF